MVFVESCSQIIRHMSFTVKELGPEESVKRRHHMFVQLLNKKMLTKGALDGFSLIRRFFFFMKVEIL